MARWGTSSPPGASLACRPGVELLAQVCQASTLPVYAIGGVGPGNIAQVKQAGATGACVMSGFMTAPDPAAWWAN